MLNEDFDLQRSQIQAMSNANEVAAFFSSLAYHVERLPQTTDALGITNDTLKRHIQRIEQIAVQDEQLYIYLFEMKSLRVTDRQNLARTFKNRGGEFLLVLTDTDYTQLDFVLLERVQPRDSAGKIIPNRDPLVQQHVLTVNRANPDRVALRVLRRFTYTESDVFFQREKLLSAYKIARWSRPMFNNLALFSDYYLEQRLPDTPEWSENALPVHTRLSGLFARVRERLGNATEEQTRADLLEPIFRELNFGWTVAQSSGDEVQPDYVLTGNDDSPLAYALTYRWDRYLDGRDLAFDFSPGLDADKIDDNPGARVVSLLATDDAPPYIIVTNGKIWRIYAREAHSRSTNYYEIDLEETLTDPERDVAIRYFWLLFRAGAFSVRERLGLGEPICYLDFILQESGRYAKELEERLKDRVFEGIFPQFAEGFIRYRWGEMPPQQDDLDAVYQATLTFLYRLMFLLYAEARDMFPVKEAHGYGVISLRSITEEIAERAGLVLDTAPDKLRGTYSASDTALYDRLTALFAVVDKGDPSRNVPHYNGGLFMSAPADDDTSADANNARFLRDTKIPDRYLALGLDRLARDLGAIPGEGLVFIDYKSLGVRQLGSIYEGLLEFKLRVAPEKMAIVKGKRTEEIVPYKKAKKKDILTTGRGDAKQERTLAKGAVYLENNKQERKATGSYYTPDYIVSYIVEHTVGPVLDEKFAALTPRLREAEKLYYGSVQNNKAKAKAGMDTQPPDLVWNREDMQQLAADVLDVKVLDPAMGSGHFLVEVVDYVTDRTLQYLDRFRHNPVTAQLQRVRSSIEENMDAQGVSIDTGRLTNVNLLKRQVLKRCVYGVDLNRMAVELAKVSLWLDAFTLGAPLSFLDHHLKHGNSLIGARVADVQAALQGQQTLFSQNKFAGVMLATDLMRQVSYLSDNTIEQMRQSKDAYRRASDHLAPYKRVLDVYTSRWFPMPPSSPGPFSHSGEKGSKTRSGESPSPLVGGGFRVRGKKGGKKDDFEPTIEFLRRDDTQAWLEEPRKPENRLPADDYMQAGLVAKRALQAAEEKRFFHWELEFPEVFFAPSKPGGTDVQLRKDGGFDAVVGNPPYGTIETLPNFSSELQADLFVYFWALLFKYVNPAGNGSFITPSAWLTSANYRSMRELILQQGQIRQVIILPYDVFPDAYIDTCIAIIGSSLTSDDYTVQVRHMSKREDGENIWSNGLTDIEISAWRDELQQRFLLNPGVLALGRFYHLDQYRKLEEIIRIERGVQPYGRQKHTDEQIDQDFLRVTSIPDDTDIVYYPELLGEELSRYEIYPEKRTFLEYSDRLASKRDEIMFEGKRVVLRRLLNRRRQLMSAVTEERLITTDNVINVLILDDDIDPAFVSALLNSAFIAWLYTNQSTISVKDDFPQITLSEVGYLPIRRIDFTTPADERERLVSEITGAVDLGDTTGALSRVRAALAAGQTDVVHDVLAHLAQTMIDLNKEKQAEMSRFLGWLENALTPPAPSPTRREGELIDSFSGKTVIRGYLGDYQKDEPEKPFDDVLDQLTKSANRKKMTVDIRDAAVQGKIRAEYERSLETLRPIKRKLKDTDALIDGIVYALYGLTEAEIAVVEGRSTER